MDLGLIMGDFRTRCSVGIVRLMRRLVRLAATFMSMVCLTVLRAIIGGVVFTTCTMLMMHYLGVPLQVPSEVLDTLESIGKLARILS